MILDLYNLFHGSIDSLPFDHSYSVEGYADIVEGRITAKGVINNHAGYVVLVAKVTLEGIFRCGRCLAEFADKLEFDFEYKLSDKPDTDDEYDFIIITDYSLDLEDFINGSVSMELPFSYLCKADCKGLCPKCGSDKNKTDCGCITKEIDPRWAELLKFDN